MPAGVERTALIHERGDGSVARYSFRQVQRLANQCANTFGSSASLKANG